MKDQNQWESASLEKTKREQSYFSRLSLEQWPQNSSWSEEVSSCMHCMQGKSTDKANSWQQPQLCKQALTFPAINFSNHCAVLACRSKAMQKLTRRFIALNCLQFIYGLYWHIAGEFVYHRRIKGFRSLQKNELLMVNPVQRGSSTDLLWTVPSGKMFGHWTPFHMFCPKEVWQGI